MTRRSDPGPPNGTVRDDGQPLTVLHVSAFQFGRRHHPATHRTIVGLAPHVRSVVVSGANPGYYPDAADDDGALSIPVHHIDDTLMLRQPEIARAVADAVVARHGPIDAVIGHLTCGARAVQVARFLGAPVLSIFHGDDANIDLHSAARGADHQRLRIAPAAFFLGISRNLVARLLDFGTPCRRTFLHHLGIDLENHRAPQRPDPGSHVRVVMAGTFRPSKGHALALRAFATFAARFPAASLHFVGAAAKPEHAPVLEDVVASARAMGLAARVHVHGALPVEELRAVLARADIALQTSIFMPEHAQIEGVPNAILEAMAMELPVVATRHGGIAEAVVHRRTGLLVDEHDDAGVATALCRLAGDRTLRLAYGRAGRRHVEREFASERQSARLAEHVRAMCAAYAALEPHRRAQAWRACAVDSAASMSVA